MNHHDFWYVVCESHELGRDSVLARQVLDERLVVIRGSDGKPVVYRDRCMHRAGKLSKGRICGDGELQCPYHGWTYDDSGELIAVPAEGENFERRKSRRLEQFSSTEQQGFVYVRLTDSDEAQDLPFSMPNYAQPGWKRVRLQNRFRNNVTNCVENFIDVPHTVFVHPGIFRTARRQRLEATVRRSGGEVHVDYRGETDNVGWFKRFLNPNGEPIQHTDSFYMPNVTCVYYRFGPRREFYITSQSVPVSPTETLVYTELAYFFGRWTPFAGPIVRYQGQSVIDQDLVALADQMDVIERYGDHFQNTPADTIHVYVESIRKVLDEGGDIRKLRDKESDIVFWV